MAYSTDSIERDISQARDTLGRQLSEAEQRARQAMDWRTHYQRHPLPLLAAAAAVGFAVSQLIGEAEADHDEANVADGPRPAVGRAYASRHFAVPASARTALERLTDAFIGAASLKVAEYAEEWMPGFHREYDSRKSS